MTPLSVKSQPLPHGCPPRAEDRDAEQELVDPQLAGLGPVGLPECERGDDRRGGLDALGARRGSIFQLIWLETLMVCFVGALVGSALAVIASGLVEQAIKALADLGVSGSIVQITPGLVGYTVLVAVVLGFFAGLYPAWRAASMRPVEAISKGG